MAYEQALRASDLAAQDFEGLGFPGVAMAVLHNGSGQSTGTLVVATRMEAGAEIPAHSHDSGNETVVVVAGDFIEEGQTYEKGSYLFAGAGVVHGPHRTAHGCMVITHFSGLEGELTFRTADEDG
ncbi:MAG TPA: cupin domain-containing protein [Solirubrobacteraceae bacterium]